MAKHAHRLMLMQKKTWRCTLPGCSFFVHLGLAYVLPGKQSVCWECGDEFRLDERALQDDQPKCLDCRSKVMKVVDGKVISFTMVDLSDGINVLIKHAGGVKKISQVPPNRVDSLSAMGILTPEMLAALRAAEQYEEDNPTSEGE